MAGTKEKMCSGMPEPGQISTYAKHQDHGDQKPNPTHVTKRPQPIAARCSGGQPARQKQTQHRQTDHQERIERKGGRQMAVEQLMRRPQSAAPGALKSRGGMKQTTRIKGVFLGRKIIKNGRCRCQGRQDRQVQPTKAKRLGACPFGSHSIRFHFQRIASDHTNVCRSAFSVWCLALRTIKHPTANVTQWL